jgi:hypothetical protein
VIRIARSVGAFDSIAKFFATALCTAILACGSKEQRHELLGVSASIYDDFASGSISATKWSQGERQAILNNQSAVLSSEIADARPNIGYGTEMVVIPPESGVVTSLGTGIQVTSATISGDSTDRSGIDLLFQPPANRVGGDLTNALFARIILSSTNGGLALRQLFECTAPDCSTFAGIGTYTGNWPREGLPIATDVRYTISVSIDTDTKIFTFAISGGAYGVPRTVAVDASAVISPFPVDLSPENFVRARLSSQVKGGTAGGGDGAVTAQFTNVTVGMNDQPPSLFDDFSTGPDFDPSKWTVGKQSVEIVASALEFALSKEGSGTTLPMELTDPSVALLQADVTITEWSLAGHGVVAAMIQGSLYNDGTNGSGQWPDNNRPGSEVGDVIATVSMGRSHVWYEIVRCDSATCSQATRIESARTLANVTLGSTHTLAMLWDETQQQVLFQLDDHEVVSVDPVAAGYLVAAGPNRPFRRIAVRAAPVPATAPFSGSIVADFDNVKAQ